MRTDAAAPTQTHNYLLAEPSLPDMFSGQAKLLYVKNENPTLGQRLKNFILKPLKIIAAKNSLLNVLRDPAFKDNEDAKKLTNHIKLTIGTAWLHNKIILRRCVFWVRCI